MQTLLKGGLHVFLSVILFLLFVYSITIFVKNPCFFLRFLKINDYICTRKLNARIGFYSTVG